MNKNKAIHRLFLLFIVISFSLWYFIPISLTLFGAFEIIDFCGISPDEYYDLCVKELLFYAIIITTFNIITGRRRVKFTSLRIIEKHNSVINQKISLKIMYIFFIAYLIYFGINQTDYLSNNDITNQEGGLLQILTFFASYVFSYFWIIIIFEKQTNKKILPTILIIVYTLILLLSGSRIYLLSIVFLFLFQLMRQTNLLKKIFSYVLLGLIFLSSLIVLPYLSNKRIDTDTSITLNVNNDAFQMILGELNVKLNSIAYSSVLLKYDGENFAGFTPYVGSLVKFIPRVIWKDKPTATSFNSDITGIPSRRIPTLLGGSSDTFNTGTSPYSVSAWQKGFWTVSLSIILNILLFCLINAFFKKGTFFLKAFAFMLTGFPQLIMLPTFGDNIIQKLVEATIILVFLFIFGQLKLIYKNENHSYYRWVR